MTPWRAERDPGERADEGALSRRSVIATSAVFASAAFFFARLWRFVAHNSVNVPYLDQWDFTLPLFEERGLRASFFYQFGPIRQGAGNLVVAASNALSDWDMRVLALVTTALLFVAMLLAVRLKVALYGRLTLLDALIPPLFFRLSQYDSLVTSPNPAHGTLPVIFVLLSCLTLTVENRVAQAALLSVVSFFATYTGFGIVFIPVLLCALVLRGAAARLSGAGIASSFATASGVFAIAATFFIGYLPKGHSLPCDDRIVLGLIDYVTWPVFQINRFFGLTGKSGAARIFGAAVFVLPGLIAMVVATRRGWAAARGGAPARQWVRVMAPAILIGYSLAFGVASELGRVCGGLGVALTSRYVTHMIPFGLGLYFAWLLLFERGGERRESSAAIAPVAASSRTMRRLTATSLLAFSVWGAGYLDEIDKRWVEEQFTGRQRWMRCARAGGGASECTARTRYFIHPVPESIDGRLEYLRAHRLSLFSQD